MLKELLTREPRRREPAPVEDRYVLHKTEANRAISGALYVEDVMSNPSDFADLPFRYRLIQHESQDNEEFERLADLVTGLADGSIAKACYVVPRKRSYPAIPGATMPFYLAEDVAREVSLSGKHPVLNMHVARYPGQTDRGLRDVMGYINDALEEWEKRNQTHASNYKENDPGCGYDPGPEQKVFIQ